MLAPEYASAGTLVDNEGEGVIDGTLVDRDGTENDELCEVVWLFPTTGNKGCETGTGAGGGSPGGVIWEVESAGAVAGKGGLTFWTGNNGCCAYGAGGGMETDGGCGYQGWGRGGTAQAAGGTGTAGL